MRHSRAAGTSCPRPPQRHRLNFPHTDLLLLRLQERVENMVRGAVTNAGLKRAIPTDRGCQFPGICNHLFALVPLGARARTAQVSSLKRKRSFIFAATRGGRLKYPAAVPGGGWRPKEAAHIRDCGRHRGPAEDVLTFIHLLENAPRRACRSRPILIGSP